jgi:hypothetical protein
LRRTALLDIIPLREHVVKEAMLFGTGHQSTAKEFTEAHVEVSFEQHDVADAVDAWGAWFTFLLDYCL